MIDINQITITPTCITLGEKGRVYATMDVKTMAFTIAPQVTDPGDQEFIRYTTKEFFAGEVFKLQSGTEVVLGPERQFTHEITLHACGNPDHGQYADIARKITVRTVGIEEAAAVCRRYQEHHNMGVGNRAKDHGEVWEIGGKRRKRAGRISYNGNFTSVEEIKEARDAIKKIRETNARAS